MNMIQRMADRLVDLTVPRVKASAVERWIEWWCKPETCSIDYRMQNRYSRWCSESWCENWRWNGCC